MKSRLTSEIVGLVKVEINMLRGYINCEQFTILTSKLGFKIIVLRCFINCQLHCLCKTYNKLHMRSTVAVYLVTSFLE